MKANGINPNGGALTPEVETPTKPGATPKKTPAKTPTKRKAKGASADGDTNETPKKRRGGKAAATPKIKSEEKVANGDFEDGEKVAIKEGMRGKNDPFLNQGDDEVDNDMFNQFVDTAAATVLVNSEYA